MTIWLFLLLMAGLLIAAVLILFWHPKPSWTHTDASVDRQLSGPVFRDDDRYWYGGVFYHNPDDPALFVPKRFGLGWTVNLGHPQGKLVLVVLLLLPLLLALLGVFVPGIGSSHSLGCHPSGCHLLP